ncbi:MAG: DNA repair protein RecN [Clostridia bacterium]|nr:DNA repair protein RecN [Clostridia bacterium]
MIKSIRLKNIAVIERAEIELENGLNVLSGETGAGKTVIINAINFALGAKADKTMIRHGETYAEAEICFTVSNCSEVQSVLNEYGVEFDDEIIVKRKITLEGRSDVKINGETVTLTMLKKLSSLLCDVYGQSEHYSLLNQNNQLAVLDGFIGKEIQDLKNKALPIIESVKSAKKALQDNGGDERSRAIRLDVLKYQINEIEKAELYEGEEDELLEKQALIKNAKKIGESLSNVNGALYSDGGACDVISSAISSLHKIIELSSDYSALYDRLYSLKAEADDIASEAENLLSNIDLDEFESTRIESRLDLIKTLKRKYGNSYAEIVEYFQKSQIECENLENFERLSIEYQNQIERGLSELKAIYKDMYNLRLNYALKLSSQVESELKTLGMKSAKFEVLVTENDSELSLNGNSEVEFLFSSNAGEPLKNMSKIISGGEMSRFMLSLKIVAGGNGETYIFDEIDAGISGEVAKIVAEKFVLLSKKSQIITISHLPQIVSYADFNYKILKDDNGLVTKTTVSKLDYNGKIKEVMRLVGGDSGETAKNHAIESVRLASDYKKSI